MSLNKNSKLRKHKVKIISVKREIYTRCLRYSCMRVLMNERPRRIFDAAQTRVRHARLWHCWPFVTVVRINLRASFVEDNLEGSNWSIIPPRLTLSSLPAYSAFYTIKANRVNASTNVPRGTFLAFLGRTHALYYELSYSDSFPASSTVHIRMPIG